MNDKVRSVPIYPILLVIAFLLNETAGQWVPLSGVVRSLAVIGGLALGLQLLLSRFAGVHVAAYATALTFLSAFDLPSAALLFAAGAGPLAVLTLRQRRVAALDWRRLTVLVNVIALISLALAGFTSVRTGLQAQTSTIRFQPQSALGTGALPDIYLILLDAYPRADTLDSALNFDNSPFLDSMRALGFDVAEKAHSNYNRTTLTVPTMLSGRHLNELIPAPGPDIALQHHQITSIVDSGAAVGEARAVGYRFVVVPSELHYLAPNTADANLDSGQLTKFEWVLARNGFLGQILPTERLQWFRENHRDRVLASFQTLQRLADEAAPEPRLVFAHVMAPHNPIVFRRDGSMANVPECFWENCDLADPLDERVTTAIQEQVEFVNQQVEATVRDIIERSDQPPIIVIFSDHGFRHWVTDGPESFRSLFLSYTPNRVDVFPDSATPTTIIPRLLNAYARTTLPIADDDVWFTIPKGGDQTGYFPLTIWTQEPPP